jgi:arginyl-tRNA synthetase
VLAAGPDYGRSNPDDAARIDVACLSASPMGPMDVNDCRAAVLGDALANLLEHAGHAVTREYFVSDAGVQMDALARLAFLRYREALGEAIGAIPGGLPSDDCLKAVGAALAAAHGVALAAAPEEVWLPIVRTKAVAMMVEQIRGDLAALGIAYEVSVSENIADRRSKLDRGCSIIIGVLGTDRRSHVERMLATVRAISAGEAGLEVRSVQPVRLSRAGEPVKMSAADGAFVSLREIVDEVGRDAVRFLMLWRKTDAMLDLDLARAIEQTHDNPVFHVQYGHARGQSVFRNACDVIPGLPDDPVERALVLAGAPLERLNDRAELSLIRRMALYPRVIEAAAAAREPQRIAFYLYELASEFHALWTEGKDSPHLRFIIQNDPQLTFARLALVQGIVTVLASGLSMLGVGAPEEMR